MKDFGKRIVLSACAMFTLFMAVGSLVAMAATGPQYGLVMTLTLLLTAAALAVLQGVWFTDKVIHDLPYPGRILGFGITAFAAIAACAWLGGWLPPNNPWAWLTFTLIFLVTLAAFCIGYQVHFKRTTGSFDAALRAYHQKMGR